MDRAVKNIIGAVFQGYRIVRGYRVLSGCLYCQGAIFSGRGLLGPDGMNMYQCFHCGRIYMKVNGCLKLWPYRDYDHLPHLAKNKTQEENYDYHNNAYLRR